MAASAPEHSGSSASQGQPVLSLRGVNKSFGAVHVLRGVDLDTYAGKVTALVGDNGAGKSTLIKGDKAGADSQASGSVEDTETGEQVKSVLLEPQGITKENVKDVIADGFVAAEDVCTSAALKKACQENGVESSS